MALQKQLIPISITNGIDTKTDEKNVESSSRMANGQLIGTKWLAAQNVDYTATGSVSKRQGFAPFVTAVSDGTSITSGKAISTLSDELLLYSNNSLFAYSQNQAKWFNKGTVSNAVVSEKNVDVTATSTFRQHYATINGVSFYAYQGENASSALTIKVRVIDDSTGTILADHTIAGGVTLLGVGTISNSFVIFYRDITIVRFRYINFTSPGVLSGTTNIGNTASDFAATLTINNKMFVAWQDNVSGVDMCSINASMVPSFPVNYSAPSTNYITLSAEDGNIRMCYQNLTRVFSDTQTIVSAPVTYTGGINATNATAIRDPNNAGNSIILYHQSTAAGQIGVKAARVNTAGTVTDLGYLVYAANLASQVQVLNGQLYFLVHKKYNTGAGETRGYFLLSFTGQIVASIANNAGLIRGDNTLPEMRADTNTLSVFTSQYYQVFDVVTPSPRTSTSVSKFTFDFSAINNFYDAVLGKQLHVIGGVLSSYDSNKITEHGFLEIPPAPSGATITPIGPTPGVGNGSACKVFYSVVYAWIDGQGQIHRSAPSVPLPVDLANGTSQVSINVKPLTLTSKTGVEIEIYRTEGNGVNYYKVSAMNDVNIAANATLLNDATQAQLTFIDSQPDSNILAKEALYTTGNVIENIAPSASRYATTYKSRIFLVSADGKSLQYSKYVEANVGVGFNPALSITLDSYGGEATALGVIDDNLVIFKKRAIYVLNGEGPNNAGQQDDYRRPALVTSDVGCVDPGSVVSMPEGLMFKSEKGIYLLNRSFSVQYLGAPVEKYNANVITSATLLNNVNQVKFTTHAGTCLVYDYFHGRWATYENLQAEDALIFQGQYTILRPNGKILTQGGYTDDGNYIPMVLESSWLQVAGLQGFQRFYRMLVAGNFLNNHKLKVSFAYDFNNVWVDEVLVNSSALFGTSVYGTGTYGTGIYGGTGSVLQFDVIPRRQKCESFRFRIETFYDGVNGADCTLSNFNLLVGVKSSANKTDNSKVFGAGSA